MRPPRPACLVRRRVRRWSLWSYSPRAWRQQAPPARGVWLCWTYAVSFCRGCMTGRAARLPPCPCAKHMPLSRRGGPARVDRPEGGTLRQEPGGQQAQEPLWGARQKRARDDDMTLYRHRTTCGQQMTPGSGARAYGLTGVPRTRARHPRVLQSIRGSFRWGYGTGVSGQRWARDAAAGGHVDFVALRGDHEEWTVSARGA